MLSTASAVKRRISCGSRRYGTRFAATSSTIAHADGPAAAAAGARGPGATCAHERDRSVRVRLQALRDLTNGGPVAAGKTADVQQHLVLQHGDAFGVCRVLAEAQELAQRVAKPRERLQGFLVG